jgi:TonB-linked SusC/RagA family outer membrane protein
MQIFTYAQRLTLFMLSLVLSAGMVLAQERTVSGKVTDENASPLPGVNVYIQGTTVGTITDLDGAFTLQVPGADAVLVFSSVGYSTQTVTVGAQSVINLGMEADVTALQEVVVTGYTTQSKRDITGAITSVDTEKLSEMPAASFAQQLQGRAAGVTIGQDNRPGAAPMVRIRGWGTINNNDPLYIIDGVPTKSEIQAINPNNIETIQILKDASAASIYGARAANGVIIITTKRGKIGAPKISFDARYGVQRASNQLELCNTQQLGELLYDAARNDYIDANGSDAGFVFSHGQYGTDPSASNFIPDYIFPSKSFEGSPAVNPSLYSLSPYYGITRANKEGTNWYDEIYQTAPIQEYNVGINGGSEQGRYYVALNYFNQDGIIYTTNFNRYSLRSNTEFELKDWIRIGENLEVSYSERVGFDNNTEGNGVALIFRTQPIIPLRDINGYYAGSRGASLGNADTPFATLDRNKDNVSKRIRTFGSAYLELEPVDGLTFKSQLGIDYRNYYYSGFGERNIEGAEPSTNHSLNVDYNYVFDWTWYNTLNYNRTIADIHRINVLVGTEAISGNYREVGGARVNFFSTDLNYRFLNAGTAGITNYNSGSESSLFSIFGKVNYSLMDKYLFEATIRRDGSSRFSEANRYATFPAFSVGWRLSEEAFLSGVDWITDLKLRGGWGQMGNQEIENYNEFTTFRTSIAASGYDITGSNNSVFPGFDSNRFGNPNGKWETTTTLDVGFDLMILNKLTANFDWYDRTTTDMLYVLTLPGSQGSASAPYQNVGEMNNTGIDLNLVWNGGSSTSDFQYEIGLNFSTYKNEIVKLSDNAKEGFFGENRRQAVYTRNEQGVPYSSFYGYYIDGFTDGSESVTEFPGYYGYLDGRGRFKYRDVDGDGVITDDDRDFIGSPHPDFTYGLNFNASYKDFDLVLFFQGTQGNDLINYVKRWTDFWFFQGNRSVRMLEKSWTPALGDGAELPIVSANDNVSGDYPSTYFIEDGSYMRLKNFQLGYTVPAIKGIDRLRVYFQATNLFTITKYTGLDPEVNINGGGSDANLGFDEGYYPTPQQFMFGLNLGF